MKPSRRLLPFGMVIAVMLIGVLISPAVTAYAAATITVTTQSGVFYDDKDGECSLPEAVANANDDAQTWGDCASGDGFDLIDFDFGDEPPTGGDEYIIYLDETLFVSDSLTIDGDSEDLPVVLDGYGAAAVSLSGPAYGRQISVNERVGVPILNVGFPEETSLGAHARPAAGFPGPTLNLQNLTLQNGVSQEGINPPGGAVFMPGGELNVDNVNFYTNVSEDQEGGAIFCGGCDLNIQDSAFDGNYSWDDVAGGPSAFGGAIKIDVFDADGGTVVSNVDIRNTDFTNNYTHSEIPGESTGGGAIFAHAGTCRVGDDGCPGPGYPTLNITIRDSMFDSNYAEAVSGGSRAHAGAVGAHVMPEATLSLDIRDSLFDANRARAIVPFSPDGQGGASGGAIEVQRFRTEDYDFGTPPNPVDVTLENVEIYNSDAYGEFTSIVCAERIDASGGGLNFGGVSTDTLTITNSTIGDAGNGNTAEALNSDETCPIDLSASGGGVNVNTQQPDDGPSVYITNTDVAYNSAYTENHYDPNPEPSSSNDSQGGGLWFTGHGYVRLEEVHINNNAAEARDGVDWNHALGGGIGFDGGYWYFDEQQQTDVFVPTPGWVVEAGNVYIDYNEALTFGQFYSVDDGYRETRSAGGGLFANGSVDFSVFDDLGANGNLAQTTGGPGWNGRFAEGGGLFFAAYTPEGYGPTPMYVSIPGAVVRNNTAEVLTASNQDLRAIGGGIVLGGPIMDNVNALGVQVDNNHVHMSTSPGPPGDVYSDAAGGGLILEPFTDDPASPGPQVMLSGSISGNTVLNETTVAGGGTNASGGGIFMGGNTLLDATQRIQVLNNSVIATGSPEGAAAGVGANASGGGLAAENWFYPDGDGVYVYIDESTFDSNTVMADALGGPFAGANGGGIVSRFAYLEVWNSTISNNAVTAQNSLYEVDAAGGGLMNAAGDAYLTNSTVSGNSAYGEPPEVGRGRQLAQEPNFSTGGGIYNRNEGVAPELYLFNVTVTDNSAGFVGGVWEDPNFNTVHMANTIIANQANGFDCNGYFDFQGPIGDFESWGYNLDSDGTCNLNQTGDQPNTNPRLNPLANYGGPTETHQLKPTSPAIDTANPAGCYYFETLLDRDQRDRTRPADGDGDGDAVCDIGAYEVRLPGEEDLVWSIEVEPINIIDDTISWNVEVCNLADVSNSGKVRIDVEAGHEPVSTNPAGTIDSQTFWVDIGPLAPDECTNIATVTGITASAGLTPDGARAKLADSRVKAEKAQASGTYCIEGSIADVSDRDCISQGFPTVLPETGGNPLAQVPVALWVALTIAAIAGAGALVLKLNKRTA